MNQETPKLLVTIDNTQNAVALSEERIAQICRHVIAFEGQKADELSLHFVDTATICQLHDEFFDDPTTTDCISFPIDPPDEPGYRVIGEVFVCPETAINYCKTHGGDPLRETLLYTVHGLLHLMGYDDIEEADREEMRAAERRHFDSLESEGLLA